MEYIRNAHSVYLLTYHIVFVTKYRRPVIDGRISAFLKDHISYLCTRLCALYFWIPVNTKCRTSVSLCVRSSGDFTIPV